MYVTYCKNKGTSDTIYHEHVPYFDERGGQLSDRLKLADYLILPVQRITKYTLLLHDFHKYRLATLQCVCTYTCSWLAGSQTLSHKVCETRTQHELVMGDCEVLVAVCEYAAVKACLFVLP